MKTILFLFLLLLLLPLALPLPLEKRNFKDFLNGINNGFKTSAKSILSLSNLPKTLNSYDTLITNPLSSTSQILTQKHQHCLQIGTDQCLGESTADLLTMIGTDGAGVLASAAKASKTVVKGTKNAGMVVGATKDVGTITSTQQEAEEKSLSDSQSGSSESQSSDKKESQKMEGDSEKAGVLLWNALKKTANTFPFTSTTTTKEQGQEGDNSEMPESISKAIGEINAIQTKENQSKVGNFINLGMDVLLKQLMTSSPAGFTLLALHDAFMNHGLKKVENSVKTIFKSIFHF